MANVASVRSSQFVQFNLDVNAAQGAPAGSVSLLCNRDYQIVDYTILVTAAATDVTIASVTPAGASTTIGLLTNAAISTYFRPTQSGVAANTTYLAPVALVARGNTLRISAGSAAQAAAGILNILPGNRYSATTSTSAYYANNATSGAQGSSATQSI